ncbi:hypothetical protein NA23_03100 [Fervidobacterium islandicum]|uniref:DUF4129 domain-containing protein n=2 Tax=Fervidobacterium TaxID=2422 RepID=H9UBE5_FERPD|nr:MULTISPECIES: hypothetical protein [Fervidobacterium]AFG34838.1 hypothetical protein Ferpe_0716 [Fervidobacterium pennivorans DSM 9078]AMW32380.1 hypothetical protein NA23_03100 [Fervidobacterium islandicum]
MVDILLDGLIIALSFLSFSTKINLLSIVSFALLFRIFKTKSKIETFILSLGYAVFVAIQSNFFASASLIFVLTYKRAKNKYTPFLIFSILLLSTPLSGLNNNFTYLPIFQAGTLLIYALKNFRDSKILYILPLILLIPLSGTTLKLAPALVPEIKPAEEYNLNVEVKRQEKPQNEARTGELQTSDLEISEKERKDLLVREIILSIQLLLTFALILISAVKAKLKFTKGTALGLLIIFAVTIFSTILFTISRINYQTNLYQSNSTDQIEREIISKQATVTWYAQNQKNLASQRNYSRLITILNVVGTCLIICSLIPLFKILLESGESTVLVEKENEDAAPLFFKTDFSFEEILQLEGLEFVKHAYLYIRKEFFKSFDHLTPYELLEVFKNDDFEFFTNLFVRYEYALERDIPFDEKNLKTSFERLVELLNRGGNEIESQG